jgi:hypothetical protein
VSPTVKRLLAIPVVSGAVFAIGIAFADEPSPPPVAANTGERSPKRAVPDYDGRGPPPTTAGDVAIWVPRIILSPLYLVSEFVIRRPLGAFMTAAERAHWPESLYNFFTFGPDHDGGFAPIALIDFGFNPSVGIYVFWNDAIVKGNDFHFHGSTWGPEWLAGSFTDRIRFGLGNSVTFKISGIRRPDHTFYGTGPLTLESYQSRYGEAVVDGRAMLDVPLWRASRVQATVGVRDVRLYHGHFGGDPSVEQSAAAGVFPLPEAFGRGYTAEYNHVLAALDSRRPRPAPGSGVRIEAEGEQGSDFSRSPGAAWIRYGATVGGFWDLNDHSRVLSLSVAALFADPLGNAPIPFTELVTLGGDAPMRGYYPGRLFDRSAAVATLRYRWPIGPWLDGTMEAAVGNVFGVHLQEFKPGLLRFSGGIGLETVGSPDSSIEALVGIGTETFDHGGQVDSIRFMFGTNRF